MVDFYVSLEKEGRRIVCTCLEEDVALSWQVSKKSRNVEDFSRVYTTPIHKQASHAPSLHFVITEKNTILIMEISARELAEYDDISNSICVDPVIGFTTHKMSPKHRHVRGMTLIHVPYNILAHFLCRNNMQPAFFFLLKIFPL